MDLSKLSANQQLALGGALATAIFSFLPWRGKLGVLTANAWDGGLSSALGVVLIIAAGVILVLESMDRSPVDAPAEITLYLAGAGLVLVLWRAIFTANAPRLFGMFLAVAAAAVAVWGAYQNMRDNS